MVLKYQSGVEIRRGDRVLLHGEPGEIELVASGPGDPESDWYVQEFGGGVMVLEPKVFGRLFIAADQLEETEDLEFVARASGQEPAGNSRNWE
jgi:hypothetical protein